MARSYRERFEIEVRKVRDEIDDPDVRDALLDFSIALDPERPKPELPKPKSSGVKYTQPSNSTGRAYLSALRCCHHRGLDLLAVDVRTVNDFMADMVVEPDSRTSGLVTDYDNSMSRGSASNYQAALRGFYHFCDSPRRGDNRADAEIQWDDAQHIDMYDAEDSTLDPAELPEQPDLDAVREACLYSQNTRRDRAFLEMAAGTGQRATALVTLLVGDVHLDGSDRFPHPHVLLNPEIRNDGDKGAIDYAGTRLRPIVSDVGPIQKYLEHHPLRQRSVREEVSAPERFEDCYLFVGSLAQRRTDPADHFGADSANAMLSRRAEKTSDIPGVDTVTVDVNAHQWRHLAYGKSKKLPIDESVRRKMFGWHETSDIGKTTYGAQDADDVLEQFAEAWGETYNSGDAESVQAAIVGDVGAVDDLPPALRQQLIEDLLSDERFVQGISERLDV